MARAVLDQTGELPSEEGRQQAARLAQEALDAAIAAQEREYSGQCPPDARSSVERGDGTESLRCLPCASPIRREIRASVSTASPVPARHTRPRCGAEGYRPLSRTRPPGPGYLVHGLRLARADAGELGGGAAGRSRTRARPSTPSRRCAICRAGSSGQAEAFSTWSEDYYWLSGRLIDAALKERKPEDLEQAFQVAERLRARSLVDTLEAAHAVARRRGAPPAEAGRVLGADLGRAAPAARSRPAGAGPRRREPGARTAGDRGGGSAQPARPHRPRPRRLPAPGIRHPGAGAAGARRRRGLLSFQISSWEDERGDFAGGSWLLVTTRGGTRVYRLPGRGELRPAVRLFNGTFERRDGSEAAPAAGLYRRLLEQPLRELPAGHPAADPGAGRRPPPAPVRRAALRRPRRRRSPPATS